MQIAHRIIGPDRPPLVIAKTGINHGDDLDVARHMVMRAARAVTKNTQSKLSDLA